MQKTKRKENQNFYNFQHANKGSHVAALQKNGINPKTSI
jgi:hypothetical protein